MTTHTSVQSMSESHIVRLQKKLFEWQRHNPQFDVHLDVNPLDGLQHKLAEVHIELWQVSFHIDAVRAKQKFAFTEEQCVSMTTDQTFRANVSRCLNAVAGGPVTLKMGCCAMSSCPQIDFFVLLCESVKSELEVELAE